MSLVELRIEIPMESADPADNCLQELDNQDWMLLEDVLARRAWLSGIFTNAEEGATEWQRVAPPLAAAGVLPVGEPVCRELTEADWRDSYKRHFQAWQFGKLHWVPVWERGIFQLPAGHAVLWLDPGLAFGTGNHETTRLCCERLVAFATERGTGGRVIDAGCGSGILALSAAKLGFRDIVAFDNDPVALEVSRENAAANGLLDRVRFLEGDVKSGLAGRQADLLLANIQADVLMRHAAELGAAVAPGGCLVLSGILRRENAEVRQNFAAELREWRFATRELGEWSDLVGERPAAPSRP